VQLAKFYETTVDVADHVHPATAWQAAGRQHEHKRCRIGGNA
jgi:hypothetical protein